MFSAAFQSRFQPPAAIDRRTSLSRYAFRDQYLLPRRAVVVGGALDGCAAATRWNPRALLERVGGRELDTDCGRMTLRALLRELFDGAGDRRPSLPATALRDCLPELAADVLPQPGAAGTSWLDYGLVDLDEGSAIARRRLARLQIEVGRGGEPGRDHGPRLLCQWFGRRELRIERPAQAFGDGIVEHLVLEAGELLFLPADWRCTVRAQTMSIASRVVLDDAREPRAPLRSLLQPSLRRVRDAGAGVERARAALTERARPARPLAALRPIVRVASAAPTLDRAALATLA